MNKTPLLILSLSLPFGAFAAGSSDWEQLDKRIQHLEQQQTTQLKNTEVSLYGSLRPTLIYSDSQLTDAWDVGDALSRIGIKGKTEFAPGWALLAQGEWKINLSGDGSFGDARLAFAGISSPFGQFTLGRQRPIQYSLVAEYTDIFNNANSPFAYNQESPFFFDNLALYQVKIGYFTLMGSAQFKSEEANSGADLLNAGLGFDWQQLHLGVSYQEQDTFDTNLSTGQENTMSVAAAYSFTNGVYLAVAYQFKDYQISFGEDREGYSLDTALALPLGKDYKLKLGYFRFDDGINDPTSLNYQGANTTIEWNPTSNIRLHVEYLYQDNVNRDTDNSVAIGIRYDFDLNWKG